MDLQQSIESSAPIESLSKFSRGSLRGSIRRQFSIAEQQHQQPRPLPNDVFETFETDTELDVPVVGGGGCGAVAESERRVPMAQRLTLSALPDAEQPRDLALTPDSGLVTAHSQFSHPSDGSTARLPPASVSPARLPHVSCSTAAHARALPSEAATFSSHSSTVFTSMAPASNTRPVCCGRGGGRGSRECSDARALGAEPDSSGDETGSASGIAFAFGGVHRRLPVLSPACSSCDEREISIDLLDRNSFSERGTPYATRCVISVSPLSPSN